MTNFPKYQIKKSINNQFYWVLYALNGKAILSGEQYPQKQSCIQGIASSKFFIGDVNFKRAKAVNGQPYFTQVASNGETLGRSEMYDSSQACEIGVSSIKQNAPLAGTENTTI